MIIRLKDKVLEFDKPVMLYDLLDKSDYRYKCAKVNNRIRELSYIVEQDSDVEFLDLSDEYACKIHQATLRFLIIKILKKMYPKSRLVFNYSISSAIYCDIKNIDHNFGLDDLERLKKELDLLIEKDIPIKRLVLEKDKALNLYNEYGFLDKIETLKYRESDTLNIYEVDGYYDYMYSYMLHSTKFIEKYLLHFYAPGFLILTAKHDFNGNLPTFQDCPTFSKVLKEANRWGLISSANYIYQMNKIIESKDASLLINLCETRHNNLLADVGKKILEKISDIKIICVAGPSSSGKTTFTNRLKVELMSLGINPLMISLDNYYQEPCKVPLDDLGKPDLEHVNALDLEQFNSDMARLISGEEITLPLFDFTTCKRVSGKKVKLKDKQVIMIEGIHALNEYLTKSIPACQKYKIYISPFAQLHIDDHNPISLSDLRLLRRIVRDYKFRGCGCKKTLSLWSSVRRGEFRWIYPYQECADYVFNSELNYEISVLRKYALPLLLEIDREDEYFIMANRLVKFLKLFKDISDDWIPSNSILREFVGNSIFYNAKE